MVVSADDISDESTTAPVKPLPLPPPSQALAELLTLQRQVADDIRRITGIDDLPPQWPKPRSWDVFFRARGGGKSHACALVRDYQAKALRDFQARARLSLRAMPLHHTYEITSVWFDEGEQIERAEQNRIE